MNGSSSAEAAKVTNAAEVLAISATAATGTVNFYVASGAVQYYTSNASANWTLNWAWSAGTTLNSAMSIGESTMKGWKTSRQPDVQYSYPITGASCRLTP